MSKDVLPPLTTEQRDLVEKNLDLARHLALASWRRRPVSQDKDDYVSVAYEGLIAAARRFDPSRAGQVDGEADLDGAFAGYARRWINGSILEWQRGRDHVPKKQRSTYKTLQALGHGVGRTPEDLSEITGMPEERIRLIISAVEMPAVPLEHGEGTHQEPVDGRPVEERALGSKIQQAFVLCWDDLPDLQRLVIALRYYEGLSLLDVAELIEVRISLVRDAHAEALFSLHEAMVFEAS